MSINVIAVDGPAGAGKSAVTQELARRLGIDYLNTGAMYRAVVIAAQRQGVDLTDEESITAVARRAQIESRAGRTYLDGEDVTDAVRDAQISRLVRYSANAPGVREIMAQLQRAIGQERPIATEGRDQGTVVFPDARCKFYLTASVEERARRRLKELNARGQYEPLQEVQRQILERDRLDMQREVGPLRQPQDAVVIDSSELSIEQVVSIMEKIAREKITL
ncbi:MAG: (d)CMP kinase [Planctomycetia bacterium]|nr:(d)CMP kinase [Planctomycetia bacterium]